MKVQIGPRGPVTHPVIPATDKETTTYNSWIQLSTKIVVCQKGTYLFTSVFNFPTVIRFKLQSSERFK
jgi:hypothetical protein